MMGKNLIAGSALMFAAGSVLAVPSDLADLRDDDGNQLLDQVPAGTYFDTNAGYVNLTDTDGYLDDSNAVLLAESATFEEGNSFGIFSAVTGDELEVFTSLDNAITGATLDFDVEAGTATNRTSGVTAMIGTTFGFFLENGQGERFYSDPTMNASGDHAGIYDTIGTSGEGLFGANLVVAFEDSADGDRDFNDMVVGFTDVVAVPEPGTLALMGMGLLGLGATRARKAQS